MLPCTSRETPRMTFLGPLSKRLTSGTAAGEAIPKLASSPCALIHSFKHRLETGNGLFFMKFSWKSLHGLNVWLIACLHCMLDYFYCIALCSLISWFYYFSLSHLFVRIFANHNNIGCFLCGRICALCGEEGEHFFGLSSVSHKAQGRPYILFFWFFF